MMPKAASTWCMKCNHRLLIRLQCRLHGAPMRMMSNCMCKVHDSVQASYRVCTEGARLPGLHFP